MCTSAVPLGARVGVSRHRLARASLVLRTCYSVALLGIYEHDVQLQG